jgi:response regulator NasT
MAVVLFTGDETISLSEQDVRETAAISMLTKPARKGARDSRCASPSRARARAQRRAPGARGPQDDRAREGAPAAPHRRSEPEAYRILQRTSQDSSVPMVDVAKAVLEQRAGAPAEPPRAR